MIAPAFDPIIHPASRLQICAILSSAGEVEFSAIRDTVSVSDSVLSKHLKQLEDAGYVLARKAVSNGRLRTWLSFTAKGKRAFAAHVAELEKLAATIVTSVA